MRKKFTKKEKSIPIVQVREAIALILLLLMYELACYWFILAKSPLKGDEYHFYKTAASFANDFSFRHILHYDELVTPLTFLLYGLWGKIFGIDLATLRLPSLLIGFATHALFFFFLRKFFTAKLSWLLLLVWIFNPYNVGFNAYIFTDGLSNLWIMIFLIAFATKRNSLLLISSVLLIYTRQYNILLVAAAFLTALVSQNPLDRNQKNIVFILAGGMFSIVPIFLVWHGFSPPGTMTKKLHTVSHFFYPESVTVYLYCVFVFTIPSSVMLLKIIRWKTYKSAVIFAAGLLFYTISPVAPSYIAAKDGFFTVGLFDKFLTSFLPYKIKHLVLFTCFIFGVFLVSEFFKLNNKKCSLVKKLSLVYVLLFLASMVFNFQIWEKYFIQILPCVLFLVGAALQNSDQTIRAKADALPLKTWESGNPNNAS